MNAETRQKILDAARQAILESGYRASVDDIARNSVVDCTARANAGKKQQVAMPSRMRIGANCTRCILRLDHLFHQKLPRRMPRFSSDCT